MRQKISERVPNKIAWRGVPNKVALAAGITPCALRVPVPGFDEQFCILPVADGLPSRGEHLFDCGFGEELVSRSSGKAIDACAESFGGNDGLLVKWMKFIFVLVAKNQWCKSGTNPWALVRKRYTEVVAVMYNVR